MGDVAAVVDALRAQVPVGVVIAATGGAVSAGRVPDLEGRSPESGAARDCARAALTMLGERLADIPTGEGGRPIWPPGFVGSLSHCPGPRVAAVGRATAARSVGVDVEPHRPIPPDVLRSITCGGESAMLLRLSVRRPTVAWSAVLWSAKESVFKAWYPLTGRRRDATECEVAVDPARGTFIASLVEDRGRTPPRFVGRWVVAGSHVCTIVVLSAAEGSGLGSSSRSPAVAWQGTW